MRARTALAAAAFAAAEDKAGEISRSQQPGCLALENKGLSGSFETPVFRSACWSHAHTALVAVRARLSAASGEGLVQNDPRGAENSVLVFCFSAAHRAPAEPGAAKLRWRVLS